MKVPRDIAIALQARELLSIDDVERLCFRDIVDLTGVEQAEVLTLPDVSITVVEGVPDEDPDVHGEDDTRRAVSFARRAVQQAGVDVPCLAALSWQVTVHLTPWLPTAGVSGDRHLFVNPRWLQRLSFDDAVFVMAHELMHLHLRSHERCDVVDIAAFNLAHDFIINDTLEQWLGRETPAGGVRWPGARDLSAESLVPSLRDAWPSQWHDDVPTPGQFVVQGRGRYRVDLLDDRLAKRLLADSDNDDDTADLAPARSSGSSTRWRRTRLSVTRKSYPIDKLENKRPWRHWRIDGVEPLRRRPGAPDLSGLLTVLLGDADMQRSWGRASRRGDDLRPGRARQAPLVHMLVDTSSSMGGDLGVLLASVEQWATTNSVDTIRVVQSGSGTVTRDDDVMIDGLDRLHLLGSSDREVFAQPHPCSDCGRRHAARLSGVPPTDLRPAFAHLDDAAPGAVLVLTDGYVELPTSAPAFDVVWFLRQQSTPDFAPPWGRVVVLEPTS